MDGMENTRPPGSAYRDSPEDLARISRYEEYLRLQGRAEGMTDAEYLAALDGIMAPGDGFADGESRYGKDADGRERARTEVRENLDDGEASRDGNGGAAVERTGSEILPDTSDNLPDGVGVPDAAADAEVPGYGPGDGPGPEDAEKAAGADAAAEAPRLIDRNDVFPADGPENEGPGEEPGPDDVAGPMAAMDGSGVAGPVADGPVPEDDAVPEDGTVLDGAGKTVRAPDEPETEIQPDGPAPESPASVHDMPAGTVASPEEPAADGGPEGPASKTVMAGGYVQVHEDPYEVHDFLDEMSVATGLASSVQTAEYVPPREITIAVPGTAGPAPEQPAPARGKLFQQMLDMNAKERERSGPEKNVSGPSL